MTGIIDYGAGNLHSVRKALDFLGMPSRIVSADHHVAVCERLLLPGVGHFGSAMARLRETTLLPALRAWLRDGRPFLGICLGMQLLFSASEEAPGVPGLDFFPGQVRAFCCRPRLQIGWNRVRADRASGTWRGADDEYYYFVNGFHALPDDRSIVAATGDYGGGFVAAVQSGRTWGVQFHPEKSGAAGLELLLRWGRS